MVLFRIALRNLWSHKTKTLIVGGLLVFGTLLVVLGQSLLTTLDQSMARSIVNSVAGHLQVYAADAKDNLALFGSFEGTEIGQIKDFPRVRKVLEGLPEVQAVIPMGIDSAVVFGGNVLDVKLEQLRAAEKQGDHARSHALRNHVRRIVVMLHQELKNLNGLVDKAKLTEETRQGLVDVERAAAKEFWDSYETDVLGHLEFLENKIAPMALGEDMIFLRYIGTDTTRYAKAFDLFEMVDGQPIPAGKRGFLFNKLTYEEQVKHKTARRLDRMRDRLAGGFQLATDDELKNWRKLNKDQHKEITYQLDDDSAAAVRKALQAELKSSETDLVKLIVAFMDMNDQNFARRYKLFYETVVPHLNLYSVKIGDTLTLRGLTASGYPTSVPVTLYGTFRFRSLDKSAVSGAANLTDLNTFRDLYGFMSADRKKELEALEAKSGVRAISRDEAEAALFGGEGEEVAPEAVAVTPTAVEAALDPTEGFDEFAGVDMATGAKTHGASLADLTYTQAQTDGGVVRNAAIMLKPGVAVADGLRAVTLAVEREKLGLKVVDWRKASGLIGDFVWVIYVILFTAIFVIFIVALVIINNSMVMATMERVREIGTMRAIGAQRTEILKMFAAEAVVLGTVFGAVGVGLGAAIVGTLGYVGIPAYVDQMVFLFAGPRLHLLLSPTHLLFAWAIVYVVAALSTIYPAYLATRITPLQAMQDAE